MLVAGIDIGSTTTKCVLLKDEKILASNIIPSEIIPESSAQIVFDDCLKKAGIDKDDVERIVSTGYGRHLAKVGDEVITEIKACSLGAKYVDDAVDTIIDVGGQDTKVIVLNDKKEIEDFSMNDKCAAGTGQFLEVIAAKLEMSYDEFVCAAFESENVIHMNSTCAVFAQSEVVSLLAKGVDRCDIAKAVHVAIAEKISSMARRCGMKGKVGFVGGGALNRALVVALNEVLGAQVCVLENPQMVMALGAALHGT